MIQSIRNQVGAHGPRVEIGIGDDAAVVASPRGKLLLCSDAMVEGVHFDLAYASPEDIGHKALACALSDIAAMNGRPLYALFSLAIPQESKFLDGFYRGATALARELGVDIVGGDLSKSKSGIFIDVMCVGESSAPRARTGAKAGDLLAVSGFPGASAAGLQALRARIDAAPELRAAHLRPRPRFDLLPVLSEACTAMIDVSDGLASEIHHLARESNVGFELDSTLIPLHPQVRELAQRLQADPLDWALGGGEDYELLVTLDPTKVARVPPGFTTIGRAISAERGVTINMADGRIEPLPRSGYNHFASS